MHLKLQGVQAITASHSRYYPSNAPQTAVPMAESGVCSFNGRRGNSLWSHIYSSKTSSLSASISLPSLVLEPVLRAILCLYIDLDLPLFPGQQCLTRSLRTYPPRSLATNITFVAFRRHRFKLPTRPQKFFTGISHEPIYMDGVGTSLMLKTARYLTYTSA
jgi:hypothetical protein